jgi:hypothetical protein
MAEPTLGPSTSGSVVLDLGPGQGALVLHTPPELDGCEIEISQVGAQSGARTHSMVRPRHTARGVRHAAVYPGLVPGEYHVWADPASCVLTVLIESGSVTTASWQPDEQHGRLPAADAGGRP